jgi:hypothetical protein
MKTRSPLFLISGALLLAVAGCATGVSEKPLPKAWRPANSFDDTPQVIPLTRPYIYKVLVVDRTLQQLVKRWAKDTKLEGEYACADDFTLSNKLVGKSFTTLNQAISEINETYRLFGAKVQLAADNRFVVDCVNRDVLTGVVRLPQTEKLTFDLGSPLPASAVPILPSQGGSAAPQQPTPMPAAPQPSGR